MKAITVCTIGDPEQKTVGTVELRDIPNREPGDEEVMVKVAYASICGSDGHVIKGELGPLREMVLSWLPMRLGHEVSGVIEKVGAKAAEMGFKPGDRVTANYTQFCNSCYYCHNGQENYCEHQVPRYEAMAEYITWHMSQIYKLPDGVGLLEAALTEPFSIALNAVQKAQLKLGSKVAVFGAGGIGLMIVQLAKMAGASHVTLFDVVDQKRKMAEQMGADVTIDPRDADAVEKALSYTDGRGYNAILDASGASSAARMALDIAGPEADIVFFSMYDPNYDLPVNLFVQFYQRGLHLHGMQTSADAFEKTVAMLPRMDLKPLIQKIYQLEEYEQAFADQFSGQYIKLVFQCNEGME